MNTQSKRRAAKSPTVEMRSPGCLVETDLDGLAILCWLLAQKRRSPKLDLDLVAELREWFDCYLMTPAARARAGIAPNPAA